MRLTCLVSMLAVVLAGVATAADWPQFLGPNANGVSPETGLARAWPEGGPKELWKTDVSPGFAAAAIEGGKVYFLDREGDKETVRCIDLASGKQDWKFEYDAPLPAGAKGVIDYPGPRATPAVDDKHVYAIGALGHMHCLDKKAGTKVWAKHLLTDFGGKLPMWGVAGSPVLYKDWVIVAPQSKTAGLAALKRDSGQEAWKSEAVGSMAYCTPLIAKIGDVEQAVMLNHTGVAGVDLKDGKVLWTFKMAASKTAPDGWKCDIPVPSPTDLGGGKFFLTGGYGGGSCIIEVKDGSASMIKKIAAVGSHLQNGILWKGHIYVNSDNTGKGLVCLDATGEMKWNKGNFDKGNLIIADGLIYILGGNGGAMYLVEASSEAYKELGKFQALGGKEVWGPIVLSGGKIVARDKKLMKCWDVTGK